MAESKRLQPARSLRRSSRVRLRARMQMHAQFNIGKGSDGGRDRIFDLLRGGDTYGVGERDLPDTQVDNCSRTHP